MESLRFYLDNMFKGFPNNQKVRNAKEELFAMMEDKYRQLRDEGMNDNVAVGIVISEFGNLDELVETLGLEKEVGMRDDGIELSSEYVDKYVEDFKYSSKVVARGVALILIGIAIFLVFVALGEARVFQESIATGAGLGILITLIAIAVFHFIKGGMTTQKYEKLEKQNVNIDYSDRVKIEQLRDELNPALKIALGVLLCIVAPVPTVITSLIYDGTPGLEMSGVPLTMLIFAIAIYILTRTGMRLSSYKVLLQEGDYDLESKEFNREYEWFNGVYWMAITAGYLLYSWLTSNWHISWIVWPIAGITFGIIQVILRTKIERKNR